jgi:molybdate transport system ATP-binding protein
MSVATNLRYGARRAPRATTTGFDAIVELLDIGKLLDRRPHTLSGGERQRVAIGRALLSQPRLLLMDEPLSGLDATRKAEILPYLAQLGPALALPIVYVTHAMDELVRLADDVVLLDAGRVVAAGKLPDLAGRGDLPLAARDDAGAVLLLDVVEHDHESHLTRLEGQGLALLVPLLAPARGTVRVRIPAREVILATAMPAGISLHNRLAGRVRAVVEDTERHTATVEVMVGTAVVMARVTLDAVRRLALVPGGEVLALVKSTSIDVIGSP